jgi:hypothetical protein
MMVMSMLPLPIATFAARLFVSLLQRSNPSGHDLVTTAQCAHRAIQSAVVQESQRRDAHLDRAGLKLLLLEQVSLITSPLLWTQLFRRAMEVLGKLPDGAEIAADGDGE